MVKGLLSAIFGRAEKSSARLASSTPHVERTASAANASSLRDPELAAFHAAAEVGALEGWEVYLSIYPGGRLAELARQEQGRLKRIAELSKHVGAGEVGQDRSICASQVEGQVSPEYQFKRGLEYERGEGVPQDDKEAARWFILAAKQGHAEAQSYLGVSYEYGSGVPEDHEEAAHWHHLAAKQGILVSQYNLGAMYVEGRGVPQDDEEAVRWYRMAAEQGDALAQRNLGDAYARGKGVRQDRLAAARWYRLAAEQGLGQD